MSTREFWSRILKGVGGLIIVAMIIGALFLTGQSNAHKTEDMTKACVAHGFKGWDDGGCFR
jgi:hypothetical protein